MLEPVWREMEERSRASFFQSWHWIGTWLDCLPPEVTPRLLKVERAGTVVGLGLIVRRAVWRHGFVRSRSLFLNCSGHALLDEIDIEHNGFLSEKDREQEVFAAALEYLIEQEESWDEFFIPGMKNADLIDSCLPKGHRVRLLREGPCRYVDLDSLRKTGKPFADTLGKSTRYNVRRSQREYEKRGPPEIMEARSLPEAIDFLVGLRELHQRYWRARGMPGSFSNAFFDMFHRRLVNNTFATGAIQLLRVTAGPVELGYLYNLVYAGQAYNYQSGFNYAIENNHQRPGLVAHVLAIEHNAKRGNISYDLLAADTDFKRSLAAASHPLKWPVLQRPRIKLRIEDRMREVRVRLRSRPALPAPNAVEETRR